MRWIAIVTAVIALGASGCTTGTSGSIFDVGQMVDFGKGPDGQNVLLDTAKNRSYWQDAMGAHISAEKAGRPPPGRIGTWNSFWVDLIRENQERKTPQIFIDYIINARRAAGLPELVPPPVARLRTVT